MLSKEEVKIIIDLYEDGKTLFDISVLTGRSEPTIAKYIKQEGKQKPYGYWVRSYKYNDNFFSKIDTEDKAYWLGFIYADGNVHRNNLSIALAPRDKGHLQKFLDSIESNCPIEKTSKLNRVRIGSKKICQDLYAVGCPPAKSKILEFPTENMVPNNLMNHFLRGVFDGDGSIWKSSSEPAYYGFSIVGARPFIEKCINYFFTELDLPLKTIQPTACNEVGFFRYNRKEQLEKIYNFLYCGASIYLDRKYHFFSSIDFNNIYTNYKKDIDSVLYYVKENPMTTPNNIMEVFGFRRGKANAILRKLWMSDELQRAGNKSKLEYFYGKN